MAGDDPATVAQAEVDALAAADDFALGALGFPDLAAEDASADSLDALDGSTTVFRAEGATVSAPFEASATNDAPAEVSTREDGDADEGPDVCLPSSAPTSVAADLDWLDGLEFGVPVTDSAEIDVSDPLLVDRDAPAFEWEPLSPASAAPAGVEPANQPPAESAPAGPMNLSLALGSTGDDASDPSLAAEPAASPSVPASLTSLPALEPDTVRLTPGQAARLFGDGASAGDVPRQGLIPAPAAAIVVETPAGLEDASEWSGWAALAEELHLGTEGGVAGGAPRATGAPPWRPRPPSRRSSSRRWRPLRSLDWPGATKGGPSPQTKRRARLFPTLPAKPAVPLMRPTLPALPRIRGAVGLGPATRTPVAVPGLSAGLAAALARETSGDVEPAGANGWDDDLDPWGSAELAAGGDDPETLGSSEGRNTRGKLGLGLDEAVEAPEGWLQVLTSDLAPIRSSIRQTVLRSGRPVHVQEHKYIETTPAGVAARVERLHGELVSRLRGQGLQALRAVE